MFKPILLTIVLLPQTIFSITLNLKQALLENKIQVIFQSKGGYQGECINLKIQNETNFNLNIKVNPGTRLKSGTDTEQDIVVTKSKSIVLLPNQVKEESLYGYCCQASNSIPKTGSLFTLSKIVSDTLTSLCKFLDSSNFTQDIDQKAIWCISENKELYSVCYQKKDSVGHLLNLLTKLTGKKYPEYQVGYFSDEQHLVTDKPSFLKYHFSLPENGYTTLTLYNSHKTAVKPIFVGKYKNTGNFSGDIIWSSPTIRKGAYTLVLFQNGNKLDSKSITI